MTLTHRHFSTVRSTFIGAFVALGLGGAARMPAADWLQFLGPERSGVAEASEPPPAAVTPGGLKVLWTHPLRSGFAGPVVAEGKTIVFHRVEDRMLVEAIGARDGTDVWRFSYENTYRDSFGMDDGPRGCPAIAQGKVIVHGAEGRVHALSLADGSLLWSYDTAKEAASPQGFFGRACSPLIVGDKVILTPGGRNARGPAGVLALGLSDGKPVWQAVDDEAGYASPVLHEGVVFCWMRNRLHALQPEDGKVLASLPLRSSMDASVNAAQPVWAGDDRVFLSAGYGVGARLLQWKAGGTFKSIWQKEKVLDCHYSTPIHHEGYLYGFHGRQEFGQNLRCVRVEDGKVMWESGRVPGGTLLRVQDTLIVLTEAGELWLVEATPEKFNRRAQEQILRSGHRSYPALANGVLYARDSRQIVAIDLQWK